MILERIYDNFYIAINKKGFICFAKSKRNFEVAHEVVPFQSVLKAIQDEGDLGQDYIKATQEKAVGQLRALLMQQLGRDGIIRKTDSQLLQKFEYQTIRGFFSAIPERDRDQEFVAAFTQE